VTQQNKIIAITQSPELTTTTNDLIYQNGNHTLLSATMPTSTYVKCPWTCELTNDAGYVVYSALGSFYIPMFVMLFFYWRIYRAAVRTTKAINQGFRTTKGRLIQDRNLSFISFTVIPTTTYLNLEIAKLSVTSLVSFSYASLLMVLMTMKNHN
jgi:hypothetical protein